MTFLTEVAIFYGIVFITVFVWGLITKRDDADGVKKVANNTANILFWGTALFLVIITFCFSTKA